MNRNQIYLSTSIIFTFLLFMTFAFRYFFWNSENDCYDPIDTSKIKVEVELVRLENELFACKDRNAIKLFLDKYTDFANRFYDRNRLPNDSILVEKLYEMIQVKAIKDTVLNDIKVQFGEMQDLKTEFEDAFKHIKFYYPQFKIPKIYTIVTGLGVFGMKAENDFFIDKEILVISLDFFLKPNRYRPPLDKMPDYVWRNYHKKAIVPNTVKFISSLYNEADFLDKTVLAEMLYYGKSYQFIKTMIPCLHDSLLIGYTSVELANIKDRDNKNYIWNHLIEKQIIFSTKETDKRAYLYDRPYVAEINAKCPGRIGQWLGWKIVQAYLKKNTDTDIVKLMKNKNAQALFNQSTFKNE